MYRLSLIYVYPSPLCLTQGPCHGRPGVGLSGQWSFRLRRFLSLSDCPRLCPLVPECRTQSDRETETETSEEGITLKGGRRTDGMKLSEGVLTEACVGSVRGAPWSSGRGRPTWRRGWDSRRGRQGRRDAVGSGKGKEGKSPSHRRLHDDRSLEVEDDGPSVPVPGRSVSVAATRPSPRPTPPLCAHVSPCPPKTSDYRHSVVLVDGRPRRGPRPSSSPLDENRDES